MFHETSPSKGCKGKKYSTLHNNKNDNSDEDVDNDNVNNNNNNKAMYIY
jgi:hypothetical protein